MPRPSTPTNLASKATGEVRSFPSRSAARAYAKEHGGAKAFRSSEYIQRVTRVEGRAVERGETPSRAEARGHAGHKLTEGKRPGKTFRYDPTIYRVTPAKGEYLNSKDGLAAMLRKVKGPHCWLMVKGKQPIIGSVDPRYRKRQGAPMPIPKEMNRADVKYTDKAEAYSVVRPLSNLKRELREGKTFAEVIEKWVTWPVKDVEEVAVMQTYDVQR